MENHQLQVTVALVCWQEKEELARVLEDIKKQTAFDAIGEALIFQNGDCKQTKKTAEAFLSQLPLKIFSSPLNNLGRARAVLVNQSKYKLIAWTDSDCSLPKNWLEELLSQWKNFSDDNKPLALGGPNRLPEKKWWQKMVNLSLKHPLGHGWSPQAWKVTQNTKVSHIPTTNGLFSRQAILDAGNFSEQYKKTGEDLELGLRLQKKGSLILLPTPLVINNYASTYFESLKRLFAFGKVRSEYKSLLSLLSCLFFPFLTGCFILGIFQKYFFLPLLFYFLFLFLSGAFMSFKYNKPSGLLLPLFWFFQQTAYSMGSFLGLSFTIFNALSTLNK